MIIDKLTNKGRLIKLMKKETEMYNLSIVELTKTGIIEIQTVRTYEEAYHITHTLRERHPGREFDFIENENSL